MATNDYVPVAGDDWYQRRRQDTEGRFFREVASQGPRKGEGGSTRQGIYCFTADGKLLAYKNAGQAPVVMRETLRQGLHEWRKLPAQRRKPGAVTVVGSGKTDPRYTRTPPPGGQILNVYTRILDRTGGTWCKGTCPTLGGDHAARDHLWLTAAECKTLLPADAKLGDRFPLLPKVAERILRFHLIDNTRGEPPMWQREEIRSQQFLLTVEEVTSKSVRVRLDGQAVLATDGDVSRARRGFEVRLLGYLGFSREKKIIERFDMVAVGDHWGEGQHTGGARPGRQALGVAFELAGGHASTDLVPPQAAREIKRYLGNDQ
jgi:hypothetical protein